MKHLNFVLESLKSSEVTFRKPLVITPKITELLEESKKDKYVGDELGFYDRKDLIILYQGTEPVGFAFPYQQKDYWKTGPFYVKPSHRGEGIGTAFLIFFYKDKKGKVYINDDNIPSQKAYKKAGFIRTEVRFRDDDGLRHLYVKE